MSPVEQQLRTRLRAAIAELPGARLAYEAVVGSPGSWLYRRPTLDWLSDPALARQLPRPYRWFARYCAAQSRDPIGAELILRGIIALSRRFVADGGIVPLRIGAMTAYLDLQDPRFLNVPREVTGLPQVLRHFLRPGDSFLDVGANHGVFSIVASGLVGKQGFVVAIEPQPRLAGLVQRSLNEGPAPFEVHQLACGDRFEEVEFYIPLATSGSAGRFVRFSAVSRHRTIKVNMRPIDEVVDWRKLPGRTFIKLDVEGSELGFLDGSRKLIRATSPALLMEMNPVAMSAADTSQAKLLSTLAELGYDRFVTAREPDRAHALTEQIVATDLILLPASFGR